MLWIVFAIVFIFSIFYLKTAPVFKNTKTYESTAEENLLQYGDLTFEDLINKDTDGDEIPDWQELLYGLDPNKKETTPGTPDRVAIEKLSPEGVQGGIEASTKENIEGLTKTELFSRELFATVAAASQNGAMDPATINALSISLSEKIQNSTPEKIYLQKDIKLSKTDDAQAVQKYSGTLTNIYGKNSSAKSVSEILEKMVADEENMNILKELDPIIIQINKIISELIKMEVPPSLATLHLDLINNSQRLSENVSGIKLLENDPIVAIAAVSQYWENATNLEIVASRLVTTIGQKLNN